MDEINLPNIFWDKVVHKLVYILSKGYLNPNNNKFPYELWRGKQKSIKDFKVFENKCYIKNNDENLGNFDSSDEGLFLAYSIQIKGYRLYSKSLCKIVEIFI